MAKPASAVYQERETVSRSPCGVCAFEPDSHAQAISPSSCRPAAAGAAGLDDASGRPLSAGIPRGPRQGWRLSRSLLHAGVRRRSHAAADPPLRLRRRDHLLRHSGRAPRARPRGEVRGRRRPAARPARYARQVATLAPQADFSKLEPVFEALRRVRSELDAEHRADRLLRRAVDGRDLHGRGQGHAGSGAGADDGLSASASLRDRSSTRWSKTRSNICWGS